MENILIIDDEETLCRTLDKVLTKEGFKVTWTTNSFQALELAKKTSPACVLLDLKLGKLDGLTVLKQIKEWDKDLPVIMLTAYETVKTAVEAMKSGAFHYMAKPFDNEELKILVSRAIEKREMQLQIHDLKARLGEAEDLEDLMGSSKGVQEIVRLTKSVASTNVNVLLLGESGTGKELVAKTIHYLSNGHKKPFIAVDCAAIPETLIESELFGHEKGAFTDANSTQKGKFELANGGTIFLDEIGNIPSTIQSKLLRFLEEHEFYRIGGKQPIKTSVRVIAATNADLAKGTKENIFRLDLFYRLNEFLIQLPPLRERREDIPFLCQQFLRQFQQEVGRDIIEISPEALEKLMAYSFPGNVRELRNIIKRAVITAVLRVELTDLPSHVQNPIISSSAPENEMKVSLSQGFNLMEISKSATQQVEKKIIFEALQRVKGHQGKAAKLLGITQRTLYSKIRDYDL